MDIEADERGFGNKRIHQRLGPASGQPDRGGKVCYHWRAGRCNRHPCPFLHSELPAAEDPSNSSKRALVWRNPNSGGGSNGGFQSKWGKGRGDNNTGRFDGGVGTSKGDRPCKHFMSGSCPYGDRCRFLHSWSVGDSFSLITHLKGHQKVITGIALPSGSDKLYSGSKDQTVKVWDCQTGQCAATVSMGHEVGCLISEGPWLFVGIPDSIKAWNTQTSAEMSLAGPTGQVYTLVAANDMLFAGAQDGRILVWRFSTATNCFEPATSLVGHRAAVISFVVGGTKLYSGSMDNTIKVWVTNKMGQLEVTYNHKEEHGIIALCGILDGQGKPVLLCSLNDNSVRLYDLPTFAKRGKIFAKQEVRAIQSGPGGLLFTGDGSGELIVWQATNKQ